MKPSIIRLPKGKSCVQYRTVTVNGIKRQVPLGDKHVLALVNGFVEPVRKSKVK